MLALRIAMPPRKIELEYRRRPSALRYMALAFWPSPRLNAGAALPAMRAHWKHLRAAPRDLRDVDALTGMASGDALPFLFPLVLGLRLQMALLTHPVFPIPIWRTLQIRNRMLQHRPIARSAQFDLDVQVLEHRVLEKGIEFDLRTCVVESGTPAWEGSTTFYARGRYGPAITAPLPALAPPGDAAEVVACWRMDTRGALRFGALTGDYNGIHLSSAYARRFGFPRAFLHPQRVIGACLARLPEGGVPRVLETALKGPVPYGAEVTLRAERGASGTVFSLSVEDDSRPAVVGHLGLI
jgi:acyl dehydratase